MANLFDGEWSGRGLDPEIRDLWRKHGGGNHGPRTEVVTMPMDNFKAFLADFAQWSYARRMNDKDPL